MSSSPILRLTPRRLLGVGTGLFVLFLFVGGALLVWVRASLPPLDGRQVLRGPEAPIHLQRDARGRPTVWADSFDDLLFGLGYLHGQDRYFQMDVLRRAGEGTLAALVGPAAVAVDRGARRHDLAGTARAALEAADADDRRAVERYTKGVNAGLASLRARPWEYLALRQSPRPWREVDAYHVGLAMYRDLQDESNGRELALHELSLRLDPALLDLLTAPRNPWEAPVEGEAGSWPELVWPPDGPFRDGDVGSGSVTDPQTGDGGRAPRGSNSFAVAGGLGRDGRALLANDMHLGLGVPATWYAVRLVQEGERSLDAVGVSLPGVPGLVVGSNGHVGWGFTNAYGDWLDHVVVEVDPDDPRRYRDGGDWHRFSARTELIEVAGAEPVVFEVDRTVWGPVVGEDEQGRPLALRWVAQDPVAVDLGLLDMLRVRSVAEALDLGPNCGTPHQNLLVADTQGRIGWTVMGRVPRRVGLQGDLPRSWADSSVGWDGWLTPEEVPRVVREDDGRLWTANARVSTLQAQRVLGDGGYALGARARRIRDLLLARSRFDESDLLAIQLDVRSELMEGWYRRLRALVEATPDAERRSAVLSLLEDWSGKAEPGSVAYRLTRDWRARVSDGVLDALAAHRAPRAEVTVWTLLTTRPAWVPGDHDDWEAFERGALDEVLAEGGGIEGWRSRTWGRRNTTRIDHLLSAALPDWLGARIDLPPREVPGDFWLPRVAGPTFGASQRMVVAPGREEDGILHLPGGPNAHPFSPFRTGDYEEWVRGEPVPLRPGPPRHERVLVPQ